MQNYAKTDRRVVMVLGEQQFALSIMARWMNLCGVRMSENIYYNDPKDACGAMIAALNSAASWCVFDKKTATRLSCWQSLVCKAEADDSYIIVLQNPLTSASLTHKQGKQDFEAGMLAWLNCMMLAIDGTHSKTRVVVSYDLLCKDGVRQLARVCRELGIKLPSVNVQCEYAEEIRIKSGHYVEYHASDLVSHPAVMAVPLCQRVYQLLSKLADGRMRFSDHEFYSEWQVLKNEYDKYFPLYHYANLLLGENQSIENDIGKIHRSLSWKLLAPLRFVTNIVKSFNRNTPEEELQTTHG